MTFFKWKFHLEEQLGYLCSYIHNLDNLGYTFFNCRKKRNHLFAVLTYELNEKQEINHKNKIFYNKSKINNIRQNYKMNAEFWSPLHNRIQSLVSVANY